MSFREAKLFVDSLKVLGFREHPVSESSFTKTNFELLAEVLDFLCQLLDPKSPLPDNIETEDARVGFVKQALGIFLAKTGLKLNAKFVYGADSFAVKELLKIVSFIKQDDNLANTTQNSHTTQNFKQSHAQLLEAAARLYRFLSRYRADSFEPPRVPDVSELRDLVVREEQQLLAAEGDLQELEAQEARLGSLVQKRRTELERTTRRLGTIKAVKPAFLDEYRVLEEELAEHYHAYVEKFRVLDFCEHQLDLLNATERKKIEAREQAVAVANKKLREDEWRAMRGDGSQQTTMTATPTGRVENSASSLIRRQEEEELDIKEDDGESEEGELYRMLGDDNDEDSNEFDENEQEAKASRKVEDNNDF